VNPATIEPKKRIEGKALLDSVLALRPDPGHAAAFLGTMNFGRRTSEADSKQILARALELGIRHIDTANAYVDGTSERIVGDAIRGKREEIIVATKCGFGRSPDGKPEGLSKKSLEAALDGSLTRLKTSYVDIYYLHVPDHKTPIEETLETIARFLEAGKIRAWGISNYAAWQVLEMFGIADRSGGALPRPVIAQQLYNVLIRQLDIEYLSFARQYKLHTTIYNPLAGGLLSGRHSRDGSTQKGSRFDNNRLYLGRYFNDAMFDRLEALKRVAEAQAMTLVELAYAWVSGAPGVDSVLLGPASLSQLEQGVAACQRTLAPEARTEIDALYQSWMGTETKYVR
jgi:aryl-alcohol dehydrogenase-like predicted oxidoreductase